MFSPPQQEMFAEPQEAAPSGPLASIQEKLFFSEKSFALILWGLVIAVCFEWRGNRMDIGLMSFYWSSARLAMAFFSLGTILLFIQKGFRSLWQEHFWVFVSSFLFFISSSISTLRSPYPGPGLEQIVYYGAFLYLFWFVLGVPNERFLRQVPKGLFIILAFIAVIAVVEHYYLPLWSVLNDTIRPMSHGELYFKGRSLGAFQHPTALGAFMVVGSVLGYLIFKEYGLLALFCDALFFSATLFSQSRIAIVVFLGIVFHRFYSIALNKSIARARGWLVTAFFFLAIAGALGSPRLHESIPNISGRLFSYDGLNGILSRRLEFWQRAVELWQKNKFWGVGLGNYKYYVEEYTIIPHNEHPHNVILRVLCETGLIGFCWFVLLIATIARVVFKTPYRLVGVPLVVYFIFELVEEFSRDAFPLMVLVLLAAYALEMTRHGPASIKESETKITI